MDDLGIVHFEGMTAKEASDLIDAELAKDTPDGPATPKQIAIACALAAACKLELVMSSPCRELLQGLPSVVVSRAGPENS